MNFVAYNQQDCIHFPLTAQSTLLTAQQSVICKNRKNERVRTRERKLKCELKHATK